MKIMKDRIIIGMVLSCVTLTVSAQGDLPARKAPTYNCGDMEYDEGTDVVYYKNTPFSGVCKTYYENNSLEREANFSNGKEHGVSKTYYVKTKDPNEEKPKTERLMPGQQPKDPEEAKGQLQSLTSFNMGVADGTWEYYYANGNMAWKNSFTNGVKSGRWTWYFENGNPKKVETYANNLKDGEYITYYEGKDSTFRKSEIHYKQGMLDGSYKLFYDNGQVKAEINYKENKEDGESLMYYETGQLAVQQKYKMGVPEGEWREWHDNGQERMVGSFVKGKKEGEHKEYYKEGQVKRIAIYKTDRMISLEEYDEFGNKLDTEFKVPESTPDENGKKGKKKRKDVD